MNYGIRLAKSCRGLEINMLEDDNSSVITEFNSQNSGRFYFRFSQTQEWMLKQTEDKYQAKMSFVSSYKLNRKMFSGP